MVFDGVSGSQSTLHNEFLTRLDEELRTRLVELPDARGGGFVSSDLGAVHTTLQAVLDRKLARGPVFCEWGSGLGAVSAVAAWLSFEVVGIEIQAGLVDASRELLADLGLEASFALGSYLMPGDEDLLDDNSHTRAELTSDAYRELGVTLAGCDVVFVYPWPGEEDMHDRIFRRHATPGALLITFHDFDRVLVQRRTEDPDELESLGWMGVLGA